jgi:hypothetical protein
MSGSNFNPQNTQCMDACPDFIGVVKIFALTRDVHVPRPKGQLGSCPILLSCRIALEPRLNIKTDLTGQAKLSIFQRSRPIFMQMQNISIKITT